MGDYRRLVVLLLCVLLLTACATDETAVAPGEPQVLAAQLAELEALPLPAGADPAQWVGLKRALADVLKAQGGRTASSAPASDQAAADLQFDRDTQTLRWGYTNPGDYNQDGLVSIHDLTPLGAYLGRSNGGEPWAQESIESVVDGNGDGVINVSDLTPLGANLGARVSGYEVYVTQDSINDYPWLNDAHNVAPELASVPLSAATGNRAAERLTFTLQASGYEVGDVYWVRPTDGDRLGTPSPRAPFVVSIEVRGTEFSAPALLDFEAVLLGYGQSRVDWDLDNDGVFEVEGREAVSARHSRYTFSKHYAAPGTYTIAVRCRDSAGAILGSGSTTFTLGESGGTWRQYLVPGGSPTQDDQLAVADIDGQAAVAWTDRPWGNYNHDTVALFYQCSRGTGTALSWTPQVQLAGTDRLGRFDLAFSAGRPAVIYQQQELDFSATTLQHLTAADAEGVSWGAPSLIDETWFLKPVFLFDHPEGSQIVYPFDYWHTRLATGTPPESWAYDFAPAYIPSGPDACALIDGTPAAVWLAQVEDTETFELRYGLLADGAAQSTLATIPMSEVSHNLHLLDGGGVPLVMYKSDGQLLLYRGADAAGSSWTTQVAFEFETEGEWQQLTDAALVGGVPAVVYFEREPHRMLYRAATDAQASAWADPEVIYYGYADTKAQLADVAGQPSITLAPYVDRLTIFAEQLILAQRQ
jgi:hypothetical protein